MVSRKGMFGFVIVVLVLTAWFGTAPAMAAYPSPSKDVIPAPPDESPETAVPLSGPSLPISDAVYRVEKSDGDVDGVKTDGEVETNLVRWHGGWGGGWGHRGWGGGWGGGWGRGWGWGGGFGRGWGYPGWGWGGRRWAFAPFYRPYYGFGGFGYPAYGLGYGIGYGMGYGMGYGYGGGYPMYGNQFAYGYGSPYGIGYGMGYPYSYSYPAYAYSAPIGVGVGFW